MARDHRYDRDQYEEYDDYDTYEERERQRRAAVAGGGRYEEYAEPYEDDDRYEDGGYEGDGYEEDLYEDDRYDDGYDDGYDDEYGAGYDDDFAREKRSGRRDRASDRRRKESRGGRAAEKAAKKKKRIALIVVEVIVLILVLIALYVSGVFTKIGGTTGGRADIPTEKIEASISDEVKENTETGTMKGYRNIALFGVDSTSGALTGNTRSDTIMIASINEDTGEIRLVSVYRDTYLNLGNDSYNKCNAAYAKGGPEQAIMMLNQNLDMNITDFVTVGFGGLAKTIDALGGIDIDVDEAEMPHLNSYQLTMSEELGMTYQEITTTGLQHLNGLQAVAYCRIRYTAGDDFKRAERQREVLMATMEKAKQASVSDLTTIANDVFGEIYTSFDLTDIVELLGNITNYEIVEQDGFPQSDMRTTGNMGQAIGSIVAPRDLASNVVWLHQFLFDDSEYQVSDEVQSYSDRIASDTSVLN
ncbi:MAG: LCP family protein [Eubacteriales bacterium]|nr:LCP family protein [Eubacteriales bacterium]